MLNEIRRRLGLAQNTQIDWKEESPLYDPNRPFISWKIEEGKLLLDGKDQTPLHPMSKASLEEAIVRLKEKIVVSGKQVNIEAIYIEPQIATGLWNEGTLTEEHLRSASGLYRGTTFVMELLGEAYTVSIQSGTYYQDYEFIVNGIPDVRRVRDIPDALAQIGGEEPGL